MKRIVATALLLIAAGGFVLIASGSGNGGGDPKYWVELDNAFGLISGGDAKIAGVRAGKITDIKLDRKTDRALVQLTITQTGFGSLRTDTHCEVRPQSLIGEYFVDCQPGTAPTALKSGSTIPVSRTSSTVAPDLVNDVLRKPYRERLSIILNELGAGVAGNAQNLQAALRRASPALRETDQVLGILARQNKILGDLTSNADRVIGDLARNRKDVGRWVIQAGNTARASAERRAAIAAGFRKLPGFLEQLRPAMASLGSVARDQAPALANLDASAKQLKRFFDLLGPFAEASRPAFRALGQASKSGNEAVLAAKPVVQQLNAFTKGTPELGKNLAIVLEHLDNRAYASEEDPRSPGGKGYTGLEALLRYVYDQVLSVNIFDSNVHILKVAVIPPNSPCAPYADVARAKMLAKLAKPGDENDCAATLGPNQAGINYPDITNPGNTSARTHHETSAAPPANFLQPTTSLPAPATPTKPAVPKPPALQLPKILPGEGLLPKIPPPKLPLPKIGDLLGGGGGKSPLALSARHRSSRLSAKLLDYLLAP